MYKRAHLYVCVCVFFFGGERELTFLSFSHLLPSLDLFLNSLSRSRSRSRSLALLASFNVISLNFWEQALQCVCFFLFIFCNFSLSLSFKLICFSSFLFIQYMLCFTIFFKPYLFFHLFTIHFALLTARKKIGTATFISIESVLFPSVFK